MWKSGSVSDPFWGGTDPSPNGNSCSSGVDVWVQTKLLGLISVP